MATQVFVQMAVFSSLFRSVINNYYDSGKRGARGREDTSVCGIAA